MTEVNGHSDGNGHEVATPAVPVIVVSDNPESLITGDFKPSGRKKGMWIIAAVLLGIAICSFSIGMVMALRESLKREDQAVTRGSELESSIECLRAPGTLFNSAVASGIVLLVDINDVNSALNQTSIDLNAAVTAALVALGNDDEAGLQDALRTASELVAETEANSGATQALEARAIQVENDLNAAVKAREEAINKAC